MAVGMSDRRTPAEKSMDLVARHWAGKTLEQLLEQALAAEGCAYEAVRVPAGPRLFMAVCVTGESQIAALRLVFDLRGEPADLDWAGVLLAEFAFHAVTTGGVAFEASKDWTAVALMAAEPLSISRLETLLGLRP